MRDTGMAVAFTILVVDDEAGFVESVQFLLHPEFRVLGTTDPREALALLDRERVHVILADQRMSVMTGTMLLRAARDRHPEIVRLLNSALRDDEWIRCYEHLDPTDDLFIYVPKKMPPEALIAAVRQAVRQFREPSGLATPSGS
jgi:two-component system probable response regulator PhcQ